MRVPKPIIPLFRFSNAWLKKLTHGFWAALLQFWWGRRNSLIAVICLTRQEKSRPTLAWIWSLFVALAAGGFAFWLNFEQGHQAALEFISGYTIETSLSTFAQA